jgi:hypothetical protein
MHLAAHRVILPASCLTWSNGRKQAAAGRCWVRPPAASDTSARRADTKSPRPQPRRARGTLVRRHHRVTNVMEWPQLAIAYVGFALALPDSPAQPSEWTSLSAVLVAPWRRWSRRLWPTRRWVRRLAGTDRPKRRNMLLDLRVMDGKIALWLGAEDLDEDDRKSLEICRELITDLITRRPAHSPG